MATQTKTSSSAEHAADDAAERIRELNERILASAKKTGGAAVDSYERALHSIADFQDKVGGASPVEWVGAIAQAQAQFTRDLAEAYADGARSLLK